jgi:hypothetical protein
MHGASRLDGTRSARDRDRDMDADVDENGTETEIGSGKHPRISLRRFRRSLSPSVPVAVDDERASVPH